MDHDPDTPPPDYSRFAPPGAQPNLSGASAAQDPNTTRGLGSEQTSSPEQNPTAEQVPTRVNMTAVNHERDAARIAHTVPQSQPPYQPVTAKRAQPHSREEKPRIAARTQQVLKSERLKPARTFIAGCFVLMACAAAFAAVVVLSVKDTVLSRQHIESAASRVIGQPETQTQLVNYLLSSVVDDHVRQQISYTVQMQLSGGKHPNTLPSEFTQELDPQASLEEISTHLEVYLRSALRGALASQQAHDAWSDAVLHGHNDLLNALKTDVSVSERTPITLDIGPVLSAILEHGELSAFNALEYRHGTLQVPYLTQTDVSDISDAAGAVRTLQWALPVAAVGALLLGLLIAPRRGLYLLLASVAFLVMWLVRVPLAQAILGGIAAGRVELTGASGYGRRIVESLIHLASNSQNVAVQGLGICVIVLAGSAALWWFLAMYHRHLNAGRTLFNRELP